MSALNHDGLLATQLLLQLGQRLRALRRGQGLGTVELAARVGITRNTLRAVENGDPSPSMGTYLRVMGALGIAGDLALLAGVGMGGGSENPPDARTAPLQLRLSITPSRHVSQDLQSLALHEEALRRVRDDPAQAERARQLVCRWLDAQPESRVAPLWREWRDILERRAWRRVQGRSARAQQLRQASPLVPLLPRDIRDRILAQVRDLRQGVALGTLAPDTASPDTPSTPPS